MALGIARRVFLRAIAAFGGAAGARPASASPMLPFGDSNQWALSMIVSTPSKYGGAIVCQRGRRHLFPNVPFKALAWEGGKPPHAGNAEIVEVTAITSDVFSVRRAMEGTALRQIVAGDWIGAYIGNKIERPGV